MCSLLKIQDIVLVTVLVALVVAFAVAFVVAFVVAVIVTEKETYSHIVGFHIFHCNV